MGLGDGGADPHQGRNDVSERSPQTAAGPPLQSWSSLVFSSASQHLKDGLLTGNRGVFLQGGTVCHFLSPVWECFCLTDTEVKMVDLRPHCILLRAFIKNFKLKFNQAFIDTF